ncbi:NAD(P)/FAD-dependent oxidoreductase [Acanthopleuribacter pedis]|uniref:FAD-dependent monooxygenase n=1 Tax=Acanthopleuribacter pedis TaxID=442870 RepID=A0A8J7Q6N1_9BACT|nr:FAD-dependent monooxygenase [Acanthopleuribacter pedis]MBO1321517.1 FAD-dependent monooxygenase [Acanthopleuribacter pedis]
MLEQATPAEVVILGGGLAGLTLARQLRLARPETRVVILERRAHPVPEAAWKVGESSVELGAHYFSEMLGLADHIKQDHLPKLGLRFFFGAEQRETLDDGLEVGSFSFFPTPSFQLDRGRLENHLARELAAAEGVTFLDQAKVTGFTLNEDGLPHEVTFRCGDQDGRIVTRWLVDCTGRAAFLKRKLDLVEQVDHKVNAVWFRLQTETKVDDWCRGASCSNNQGNRWLSTNHLMGPGYWVWVIPLSSGSTSFGIVADPRLHRLDTYNKFDRALAWLQQFEPLCGAEVAEHRDKLQDFLVLKNFSHGAKQVFSVDRWALSGEAGVFLDPFYSPGSDFIGVSNTFISDLVLRDLRGKSIRALAPIYEQMYQGFFKNTLVVYQDQYPLFGNARVMTVKIYWDYAVYWSLLAFVFIQGRLCDLRSYGRISDAFQQAGALNNAMQQFFRDWHGADATPAPTAFLDQEKVDLMVNLNRGLKAPLDEAAFLAKFEENKNLLFALAAQITKRAQRRHPQLAEACRAVTALCDHQQVAVSDGAHPEYLAAAWPVLQL